MDRRAMISTAVALGGALAAEATGQVAADGNTVAEDGASRELIAYCGLYCGLCSARTQIPEQAAALAETLRKSEHHGPAEFDKELQNLATPHPERYCRAGKCGHPACAIRKCAQRRNVDVCPLCDDYPCEKIKTLAASEPTMLHDGNRMKQIGLEAWIKEQEERRKAGFCYANIRCLPCKVPLE